MSVPAEDMRKMRELRDKLHEVAALCGQVTALGYSVAFNIDAPKGVVAGFQISRLLPIDLGES